MFSVRFATLLFGFCFLGNSVTASNVTTAIGTAGSTGVSNVTSVHSTTTPSSDVAVDSPCSSYVSKMPGSSLKPSEEAVISCQCSASSCPTVDFLNGDEFIFVVEKRFDMASDSCSLQYTIRLRSYIKVGRERITINCKVPETDVVFGSLDVYSDTPLPVHESPRFKSQLSIYMILAIVAFVLLTILLLGFLLLRQIRSRRRTQRNAACRSPFIQSQTNYAYAASPYPTSNGDGPPSYNEATLAHTLTVFPKEAVAVNEKMEKVAIKSTGPDQTSALKPSEPKP